MGFYLDICNSSAKYKDLESLSKKDYDRCIHIEKTNKKTTYFKIDKKFSDYVTNYNKIFDIYLVKSEFDVEFINFTDFIKTESFFNTSIVNMKKYSKYYIYQTIYRGR